MTDKPDCPKGCNRRTWDAKPKRLYIREYSQEYMGYKKPPKKSSKWVPVGWRCPHCKYAWFDE